MGKADYFRLGDWNARCDRCGRKFKGSELRQTWQGYMVCDRDWEPRQPQDFVRSIPEHPAPDFVRDPPDTLLANPGAIVAETDSGLIVDIDGLDYIMVEGVDLYFLTES